MSRYLAPDSVTEMQAWLGERLPGSDDVRLSMLSQTAGNSHAIYSVDRGDQRWVLRVAPRTPEAQVGNAYNLQREWQILDAIRDTAIPHPAPVLRRNESAPILQDFLLQEYVDGLTLVGAVPQQYSDSVGCRMLTDSIVDTLSTIATTAWQGVGLDAVARPDGYLARQFDKGRKMMESFRTRQTVQLDSLLDTLERQQPTDYAVGLIHGDYSPLNLMVPTNGPAEVKCVLDWETATVGAALIDIGYLTARWVHPDESPVLAAFALGGTDPRDHEHLPSRGYLARRYADNLGLELDDLPYFQGLAMARVAIALEGRVAHSSRRGDEQSSAFFAALVDAAVQHGSKLLYA